MKSSGNKGRLIPHADVARECVGRKIGSLISRYRPVVQRFGKFNILTKIRLTFRGSRIANRMGAL